MKFAETDLNITYNTMRNGRCAEDGAIQKVQDPHPSNKEGTMSVKSYR
jgi:hypothetical protein